MLRKWPLARAHKRAQDKEKGPLGASAGAVTISSVTLAH